MSARCCRSIPRCGDCPVRVLAARKEQNATAALVTEILVGRPPRPLPADVSAALTRLDECRRGARAAAEAALR